MGRLISASRSTLRSIVIQPSTPPGTFPAIFNLPLLRSLRLEDPQFSDQVPSEILSPLEDVSLIRSRSPSSVQFLRRLSTNKLARVTIIAGVTIQLHTSLSSLTRATATLKHLSLSPVTALGRSNISLLCTFTNMTSLVIGCICGVLGPDLPCSFQLTDQDVLDLGGALPRIHSLNLSSGCRKPCHVTFKSLISLSRICGSLECLSIRVDFASIVDGSVQQNNRNATPGANNSHSQRGRSKVWMLNVGNSSLPDTPRCEWIVALALFTAFPSINLYFTPNERWREVRDDISICRQIFRAIEAEGKSLNTRSGTPMLMRSILSDNPSSINSRKDLVCRGFRPSPVLLFRVRQAVFFRTVCWCSPQMIC